MKEGRSLQSLVTELQRQVSQKKDFIADTRALEMAIDETVAPVLAQTIEATERRMLLRGIGEGMPLAGTAHDQIAARLQIPRTYYDRMMTEAPELLVHNVNHWLHAQPERRMVRTLDGRVRAFLSEKFRPLDNWDLAEVVLPQLLKLEAEVVSAEVTDHRFYLKATTPRISGEVRVGQTVQAGIVVSNSEIGDGSLRIEEMTYVLTCRNGATHGKALRKTHVGRATNGDAAVEDVSEYFRDATRQADDKAFWMKVQDAVGGLLTQERFDKLMVRYHEAVERKIEDDPIKVVEVTTKRFGLTEDEGKSVLRHLLSGNDLSAYGLSAAITRMSADADSYERASELEVVGGGVIELSKSDWLAIAASN